MRFSITILFLLLGTSMHITLKKPQTFFISLLILVFLSLILPFKPKCPAQTSEDKQAKLFVSKCTGCHTVGGGDLSGPDLIKASKLPHGELIKAIKRMEERVGPMEEEEIKGHVQFLKSKDVKERIHLESERKSRVEQVAPEEPDETQGAEYFHGTKPFSNGGTACIACHLVSGSKGFGGGTLGPSLYKISEKFSKRNLASGIQDPKWKIMRDIYKTHPITKQEAIHLTAYLFSQDDSETKDSGLFFLLAGFGGCLISFGIVAFFYRNRLTGVRKKIRRS